MKVIVFFSGLFLAAAIFPAAADSPAFDGPVFDTHMHYSRSAWEVYPPAGVLRKMNSANVTMALVSSTPDEGTAKLSALAPERIIPGFRPYLTPSDKVRWFKNSDLLTRSKTRLARRLHKAFGEVVLYFPQNLEAPQMAQYLDMVAGQNLVLHLHSDAAVVAAVFRKYPEMKILWAHAGFLEPAAVVARMLDEYPGLWAELSYRADDITGVDGPEAEWKELLIRHQDRFTIGSDTWKNPRWEIYQYLIDKHRNWLGGLPPGAAAKIAYENAAALFMKPPAPKAGEIK